MGPASPRTPRASRLPTSVVWAPISPADTKTRVQRVNAQQGAQHETRRSGCADHAPRGIGEAIARAFAREGAEVVVTGRDPANGQRVVDAIAADHGIATFARCDVNNEDDVRQAVNTAVEAFG